MLRGRLLASVTMGLAVIGAPAAHAATLTVNSTYDETNAQDASCSLREAILAVDSPGSASGDCAAAAFGANTIVLAPSRYYLGSVSAPHTPLQIASTVTNLTIEGAGVTKTTIDGTGLGNRVFDVAPGANVTLKDLEINGGHAPDGTAGNAGAAGGAGENGGAILNQGTLTVLDSMIDGSQAGNGGKGGDAASAATPGGAGGAGGEGGAIFNTGGLTLTGVTIARAASGAGGAGGTGGQQTTNPAGAGGAGGAGGNGAALANEGGTVTITGSAIRGNTGAAAGSGGTGGGSSSGGSGTGGTGGPGGAGSSGGGIWSVGGSLRVTNSTIASNVTGDGGGGGNGGIGVGTGSVGGAGSAGGTSGSGGGIAASGSPSPHVLNATIVGNKVGQPGSAGAGGTGVSAAGAAGGPGSAGSGGGLAGFSAAVINLENSLLALNGGTNCAPSAVTDGGHNLSFGDGTCPANFANGDPNLGPLQDNGGPTWTVSLLPGSAAIDQIPATGTDCPATDQRGVARPVGPKCDIGAYELAGPKVVVNPPTAVTRTTATLHGSVTPNAGIASAHFIYGPTTKYGSSTRPELPVGVTPTDITATVHGLRTGVTYHYRFVVSTELGTVESADETFTTVITPKVTRLTARPTAFKAGRGTTISYTDSQAATTSFVVFRLVKHRAPSRVRRFSHIDRTGRNTVRFTGRGLNPGGYRLTATPKRSALTGATVTVTFTITR